MPHFKRFFISRSKKNRDNFVLLTCHANHVREIEMLARSAQKITGTNLLPEKGTSAGRGSTESTNSSVFFSVARIVRVHHRQIIVVLSWWFFSYFDGKE